MSPAGILISLSAAVGVVMTGLGIIWPLVPVYAVHLGAGGLQVGIIIASFNLARTLFNPLAGRLSDRWGRKPFIAAGLLLYALVSVLYVMANRVEALMLVRFLHGFTSVLVGPVAMALAADIAPPHRLGRYMGTLNMAVMLGLGVGPMLGGIIRDFFGMAAAFYAMGGLALLTFAGVAAFLPGSDRSATSVSPKPPATFKNLLSHRVFQGIFLLRFFVAAGQGSVYTFLPLLALGLKLTSTQVGIILGVNIFLIALLQRVCGDLADRINPVHMIIGGTLISGLAVIGMPFVDGFNPVLLLNILMGIGNGITMPAGFVITGQLGKELGMGSVMGVTDAGWSLGMIASPILSGIIMDTLGLGSIFLTGGILIIAGTGIIALFLKGYRTKSPA
ncbi:MAG: MFS transporter [Deltaproteobacteria bacterium]|nr:MFS transporter [Deltaproteobacteria bacterium]